MAIDWPRDSRNLADYPAFVKKRKSARQRCCVQLEEDHLCEIFREKCVPPVIARRLAYFFSMDQVWDFLDVAMEKPRQAMEACVAAMEELKPVKQAESECLWKWYKELRAIGERANIEGVYTHLLAEAVANKILSYSSSRRATLPFHEAMTTFFSSLVKC